MTDPLHTISAPSRSPALPHATQLGAWMIENALPFWASREGICGMPVVEAVNLDGTDYNTGYLRLRVMARQVAVFCSASDMGIAGMRPIADSAWEAFLKHFYSPVSGWASRIGAHGQVIDLEFSLYDQAFAIFACARRARLTGDRQPIALAHRTARHIDELLGLNGKGAGWRAAKHVSLHDQNSHMHFLEALLALHEVHPSIQTSAKIDKILTLLSEHLFDCRTGTIAEWFDPKWRALEPARIEPGHQFEWYWLLTRAHQAGFEVPVPEQALFDFARRHGFPNDHGLIINACARDGHVTDPDYRLWPHCEAIRAGSVCPDQETGDRIVEEAARGLLDHFLVPAAPGAWHDRLDTDLTVSSDHVPASSLYHLWEAVVALHEANLVSLRAGAPC